MTVEGAACEPGAGVRVAVVIPAYNEAEGVADTIKDYKKNLPNATIVVIDNNSEDATYQEASASLRSPPDFLLREIARGKGHAMRAAVSRVDADVYVFTDADLTYTGTDARKLFELLVNDRYDMVVGDRVSSGAYDAQNRRRFHGVGNVLVSRIVSLLANHNFHDVLSGLRVVSGPLARNVEMRSSGFQVETEFNLTAAYLGARVIEAPIQYKERPAGSSSKLRTFVDGWRILKFALVSFSLYYPVPVFIACAVVSALLSLFWGALALSYFIEHGSMPYTATAIAAAGFGIIAVQLAFAGLMMGMRQAESRRQAVMRFREMKQIWNARLDSHV